MTYDFKKDFDAVVVGGGVAGCAAALESARSGLKTVLLEKQCAAGGLATSGLICIYLPLCDGNGRQVTFGIAEELLRNSITMGPGGIPPRWREERNAAEPRRFRCTFSPAAFMLTLEKLLIDAGVEIWYDTRVCDAELIHGKVSSVSVVNESGFGRITARCFIDASGTCVIAHRTGLPCIENDNCMTVWALEFSEGVERDLGKNLDMWNITMSSFDGESRLCLSAERRAKFYPGLSDDELLAKTVSRGCSGKIVSDFVLESHRILREHYAGADREKLFPVILPGMPQLRKIRCIRGEYVLKDGDAGKHFPDSAGLIGDWRRPGCVWEIPFRTLRPAGGIAGLLCAGRCSSASGDAWEASRVIPSAAMTGQICGLAAALSVRTGREIPELDTTLLRDLLEQKGFVFHEN